jgi:flagellar biosynthesis/type III secretory pathway protein FliH
MIDPQARAREILLDLFKVRTGHLATNETAIIAAALREARAEGLEEAALKLAQAHERVTALESALRQALAAVKETGGR